jgi:UV DNA damage repair endonuclease
MSGLRFFDDQMHSLIRAERRLREINRRAEEEMALIAREKETALAALRCGVGRYPVSMTECSAALNAIRAVFAPRPAPQYLPKAHRQSAVPS